MFEAHANWIVYDLAGMQGTAPGAALHFFLMAYRVMSTPGVVVDGKVVHAGGVPDRGKVENWLGDGSP